LENNWAIEKKLDWIKEFWHYRELFYFFVWRDIKLRYKQTVLGALWAIIQPFFTMVVFSIFFGKFAKMPSEGAPYPIFSYSALVPWIFFTTAVGHSGNSLIGNTNLLTKVYFPRFAIPASAVLSGIFDFFIASIILLGLMIYFHIPLTLNLFFWPLLTIPLIFLALGLGLIFSSLNVKYRDIKYTIPFLIQIWLYLTPIIYPINILPDRYKVLIALNPMTGIIEVFRSLIIPNKQVDFGSLIYSVVVSVVILFIGIIYFRSTEREFADIV